MLPAQLKETTMDPKFRTLLKVEIDDVDFEGTREAVDSLMGTKADARFRFIQERAVFAENLDI
ncbi:DNA gyrase subunit B [compost metagenome]